MNNYSYTYARLVLMDVFFFHFDSVLLDKRHSMTKVQVKGIFVGAKVVRGPDWDWGNQVNITHK